MDTSKMTKEEYEEYLDETDLEEEFEEEFEKESTDDHISSDKWEQDAFEEAKEFYRRDNGNLVLNPSKIFGTLIGVVAVAAHVIHTFVANVFFGKYEQLAIREAFMRGLGKLGEPGEISTKEEETTNNKEEEKENAKDLENTDKQVAQEYTIKKADIPNHISQPPLYAKEGDVEVLKAVFCVPEVQHIFALNGYLVDRIANKDKAFFFEYEDGKVNGVARGFQASEFVTGNLNGMSRAIQEIDHVSEIEAAFKSCSMHAGMVMLGAEADEYSINTLIDKTISSVNIKTDYGSDTVSFSINKNAQIDVLYNGEKITTIDTERLCKEPFDNYRRDFLDSIPLVSKHEVQLSNDIKVSWDNNKNELSINKGETSLGTFSFTSEKDIAKLANELQQNHVSLLYKKGEEYIPVQPEVLAYTLAVLTNPDMKLERTEDGMCINPISHAPEQDGQSHIYATHHERGVELYAYLPNQEDEQKNFELCSFSSRNELSANSICEIAACIQETSRILNQIPDVDVSYKRNEEKSIDIAALKPEKDDLSPDLFHGLYDKCRNEIGFGDTVIPATIPLDQVIDELKEAFGTTIEDPQVQTEEQFQTAPIKFVEETELNDPPEVDEEQIENTSLFVPAYDEER